MVMTNDRLIESALREEGVFPPSVIDRHYGDKAEMTRAEIIVRSLEETGMVALAEKDAQCGRKIGYLYAVIAGLERRLPDGKILTCGAFRELNVGCCDACHSDPLHGMTLLDLPDGSKAWVCCAMEAACSLEPFPIFHGRTRNPPEGMTPTRKSRNGGRRED